MVKFFTSKAMKALAVSSFVLVAGNAMAQDQERKLYLCDVYTEDALTSDIFGVPMRIDMVGDGQYVARYYNQKANNEIYFSANKTDFSDVYGVDEDGAWSSGASLADVKPIILPEADKYYQIDIDENEGTVAVKTYEVADYMDPVFLSLMSLDTWNVWDGGYVEPITDEWTTNESAWKREFYFGYTCTEYLINDDNKYVDEKGDTVLYDKEAGFDERVKAKKPLHINDENGDPLMVDAEQVKWCELWHQNPKNPHQYIWNNPKHFVAGQKLNFIVHNWHEAGWWNDVTWRVDDEVECDIFYYYGKLVKTAYLDYAFGEGKADFSKWIEGEVHRKELIYGGGSDLWCKPTVQKTGDYMFVFDTHLGRGKMVLASELGEDGIADSVVAEEFDGPAEYYNLNGMRVNGDNLATGIYIMRQGSKASKVYVK